MGAPQTTTTHTAVNATTTSGQLIAANAYRTFLLIVNDSDTDIYIKIGATAVANQGIRINAHGDSYVMSPQHDNLDTRAVNAIHAGTGNKAVLMTECSA